MVFGALRRFGIALRLRALVGLLLALERRRIAHPKGLGPRRFSKLDYSRELRPAKWVSIKLRCKIPELPALYCRGLGGEVGMSGVRVLDQGSRRATHLLRWA